MNDYDETDHSTDAYRPTDLVQAQRNALAQRAAQLAAAQNAALGIIGTAAAAGEFVFNTGGQERFRIDASGNFGTSAPQSKARDISHPFWQATVSEICDLWLARFGDKWVQYAEIENEDFEIIVTRLTALKKIESHQLNQLDSFGRATVLRIVS